MEQAGLIYVGTAGWSVPRSEAPSFPGSGAHLERYARVLPAAEINTSFYRPHRQSTYRRWADSVPDGFRFAVKTPRALTHERRLEDSDDLIDAFLGEVRGLGSKLGVILVQLPPSLPLVRDKAAAFFRALLERTDVPIACEPRHRSWFADDGDAFLVDLGVARVAADPAIVPQASQPAGDRSLSYVRLHGSPRMYYSDYTAAALDEVATRLMGYRTVSAQVWCIFDNTAAFAAAGNAVTVAAALRRLNPTLHT